MPDGVLIKTTLVDFPGRVACTFFFKGCNLRCPYCYNTELVAGGSTEENNFISQKELFAHLEKRKNVLSGLVLSGGEALLSPILESTIIMAKSLGYKIKLDTNGTLPIALAKVISGSKTRPDYIAMDIKTSPDRYKELQGSSLSPGAGEALRQSVKTVSESYSTDAYEFRTVLVPGLITKEDIKNIAGIIPYNSNWIFSPFQNNSCLSAEYTGKKTYTDTEMDGLTEYARSFIPKARLR